MTSSPSPSHDAGQRSEAPSTAQTIPHTVAPTAQTAGPRTLRTMQAAMHALFCVLLVVGLVRGLVTGSRPAAALIAATAAFAALYAVGLALDRRARQESHAPAEDRPAGRGARPNAWMPQAWISVLVVAWIALLWLASDFAWLAFALYFLVLHVARRALAAALTLVVLVASIVALSGNEQTQGAGAVIGPVMGMLVALGISWVYAQVRRESDRRAALVTQLVAAQDDVLASQEELALAQHEAGVLAERERLARDIHDTLAQGFSSIVLLSRAGLARTPDDALLQQIERQAAEGLTQAREVVHALAPTELADAPLYSALQRLGDRLTDASGIDVATHLEGQARALGTAVDVALLRIAQGGLANVRLHSGATRAGLTLGYEPDAVTLEIIDDGIGFTAADVERAPLSGSGFGLRAIRERAEALGGTLTVESAPGDGTALLVRLPTAPRANEIDDPHELCDQEARS